VPDDVWPAPSGCPSGARETFRKVSGAWPGCPQPPGVSQNLAGRGLGSTAGAVADAPRVALRQRRWQAPASTGRRRQYQPGPAVGLLGMTHPRHRPAQGLFHEAIACSRSNLREYALQMSPGPPLPLRSTTTRASWVCGSACATCPPRSRPRSPAPRAPFRNRSARLFAGSWGCKPDQHLSRTEP
jgi:hypothetical protein